MGVGGVGGRGRMVMISSKIYGRRRRAPGFSTKESDQNEARKKTVIRNEVQTQVYEDVDLEPAAESNLPLVNINRCGHVGLQ